MPIGFARIEFVKRVEGRNACQRGAYNARDRIEFQGNETLTKTVYDYRSRQRPEHHKVLLPEGVDQKFKSIDFLWNAAEAKERRVNSQTAIDIVLALPDDSQISLKDRIALAEGFVKEHLVDKGLAAQVDIHSPERTVKIVRDDEKLGVRKGDVGEVLRVVDGDYIVRFQEEKKLRRDVQIPKNADCYELTEHNWHAHILATTRRFTKDGKGFEDKKARDVVPQVRKGKIIAGPNWPQLWTEYQNRYFQEKGLALRVDPKGLVPQDHLGPARLRTRALELLERHEQKLALNAKEASNPKNLLRALVAHHSVFGRNDVESLMGKHVPADKIGEVREGFWRLEGLVSLRDPDSGANVGKYSAKWVVEEERQGMRVADRVCRRSVPLKGDVQPPDSLKAEQAEAFRHVVRGKGISCIEGYAGTGKSYLLDALRDAYERQGMKVRGFSPDNTTAKVLREKGLRGAQNSHRFLFSVEYSKEPIKRGKEVWIIDEAGKLGNGSMLEILKLADKHRIKLVFSGDPGQMPAVERGGLFAEFCEKYGSSVLFDIQRQRQEEDRKMAQNLARGEIGAAFDRLSRSGGIQWAENRKEAIESLVKQWADDHRGGVRPANTSLIIAHTNGEVRALNEMVRLIRKGRGEIGKEEFECEMASGKIYVSRGDLVEFRKNDKKLGVENGMSGSLVEASEKRFVVAITEGNKKTKFVTFDPRQYNHFQLGYATTCFRAQSRTENRVYMLHSPLINRQMAYVALTRHVDSVRYFVPKDEATTMSDLVRQASRRGGKATTLGFTYDAEITERLKQEDRKQELAKLRESPRITSRLWGHTRETFSSLGDRLSATTRAWSDRMPNAAFYNPKVPVEEGKRYSVKLVEEVGKVDAKQIVDAILKEDTVSVAQRVSSNGQTPYRPPRHTPKGERYPEDFDRRIVENIDGVLHRLFPEGPSRRTNKEFRFGRNGALSVTHSGSKAGQFFDFERGEGGGILQLVQREFRMDYRDAKRWLADFVGANTIEPMPVRRREEPTKCEPKWISETPPLKEKAPSLDQLGGIANKYDEVARHPYRDADGKLLYYVLRLQEKADPSKKITPPLSYGHFEGQKSHWKLKGFDFGEDKRVLYNLPEVSRNSRAPVLVVEGEKTVDLGKEKFPEKGFVLVTWSGGAGGVNKTDWSPLFGRDVVIWPDNDAPGVKAADTICHELRKGGVRSLEMINPRVLKECLPPKWDLADAVPKSLSKQDFVEIVRSRSRKAINIDEISTGYKGADRYYAHDLLHRIENKLRPGLEERYGGDHMKIREEIREAFAEKREEIDAIAKELKQNPLINASADIAKRLSHHIGLFEVELGRYPKLHELLSMKQVIEKTAIEAIHRQEKGMSSRDSVIAYDKSISAMYGSIARGHIGDLRGSLANDKGKDSSDRFVANVLSGFDMKQIDFNKQKELQR